MEKLVEGEPRGFQRGPNVVTSRLPPRIPSFPGRASVPSDLGTAMHGSQSFESLSKDQRHHKRTPSCNMVMQEQPVWLNELLEDSEGSGSGKKSSHRRSASDSFAFLENAGNLSMFGNIADEKETAYASSFPLEASKSGTMISGSCLTDLLDEIRQLQDQRNAPISAITQPAVSRSEIPRVDDIRLPLTRVGNPMAPNLKGFPGKGSSLPDDIVAEAASHENVSVDLNSDFKKAKRQSAQRSRVRKLQYIAELERIVNALQTQLTSLSPQVLLFQHQCTLLSMDNTALKQKIGLCIREKSIKDSQNETLSNEVQRLQELHELQLLHDSHRQKQQSHRIHRHSSLPTDFGVQLQQYKKSTAQPEQAEFDVSSQDMLPRVMEELAGMSFDAKRDGAPGGA